jgi:hypothetical protein
MIWTCVTTRANLVVGLDLQPFGDFGGLRRREWLETFATVWISVTQVEADIQEPNAIQSW